MVNLSASQVEEFQKAKGLRVDGKVGPKTWAELQKYLVATAPAAAADVKTKPVTKKKN